jgi:hypothetical protein
VRILVDESCECRSVGWTQKVLFKKKKMKSKWKKKEEDAAASHESDLESGQDVAEDG